jgi:hypothetical protein
MMSFIRKIQRSILRATMEREDVDHPNRRVTDKYKRARIRARKNARGY